MKKLILSALLVFSATASASSIGCQVDETRTFTAFFSDKESGFYMEYMQSEMQEYNTIVATKRRNVHIPVLNVKATEFTHKGSNGAVFTYLTLNRKIYQPELKIDGEVIKLFNCL